MIGREMVMDALPVIFVASIAFSMGWNMADLKHDSTSLAIMTAVNVSTAVMQEIASDSARKLELKLDEIQNAPPREIRTEIVKPIFSSKCLSDEFVSMYNETVSKIERTISGKSENEMSDAAAALDRNAGK